MSELKLQVIYSSVKRQPHTNLKDDIFTWSQFHNQFIEQSLYQMIKAHKQDEAATINQQDSEP